MLLRLWLASLLLAAALPSATLAAPPPQRRLFSVQDIKEAVSSLWSKTTTQGLGCADCMQLALEVGTLLYKPPNVDSDDPNIAVAGPGRRMRIKYKEAEITAALDAACGQLAASQQLSPAVQQDCERRMREHRLALEDFIFDKGTEGLAAEMCVEKFKLCDWHGVMDSGEL